MKRRTAIRTLALALAGSTLFAPVAAGADPVVTANAGGRPISQDDAITLPATLDMVGTGCPLFEGKQTYMGDFASMAGDPLTSEGARVWQHPTIDGSVDWAVTFDPEPGAPDMTVWSRWYCATATPTSLTDPALLWVGPLYTVTISGGTDTRPAMQARMAVAPKAATHRGLLSRINTVRVSGVETPTATEPTVTVGAAPDALPALDKMGVYGPQAATLKARVDAAFDEDRRPYDLATRVLGRSPAAQAAVARLLQEQYVRTAYRVVGHGGPNRRELTALIDRLDAGETRVTVVEDIALTAHSAGWWNAHL